MIDYRGHETDCIFFISEHCQGADESWCSRDKGIFDPTCKDCDYYMNKESILKSLRSGYWKNVNSNSEYICSECGNTGQLNYNFCPYCGAKMKGFSLEYKNYHTIIRYSSEDNIFYGKIEGIRDSINFHSEDIGTIEIEFHNAVDAYIDFCKRSSKEKRGSID